MPSGSSKATNQAIQVYKPVQLVVGGLLCGRDLFDRRCVGAFALSIGFAEQLVDNASSLFFLDSIFPRFLLLSEEPGVYFPAH